jgi:hypothetical protein
LWLSHFHQAIPTALFGRFDHDSPQSFQSTSHGLGDSALRPQRREASYTQLNSFLRQPTLPVTLRQRYAERE